MASIKVKFRHTTIIGNEGTLYYQIIKNRATRQLKTNYKLAYLFTPYGCAIRPVQEKE